MKYFVKSSYPFTEKTMTFILKQNCVSLGQNKFETSPDNIKKILDISVKLEELLIHQSKHLDTLSDIFSNNKWKTLCFSSIRKNWWSNGF